MKVKYFDTNQAIDDYVRNSDYGTVNERPYLLFAVNFDNYENHDYEYGLRFNVSGKNSIINPNSQGTVAKYYPYLFFF